MAVHSTVPSPGVLFGKDIKVSTGVMWAIFWVGAASFVPLLFLQYVGEEGVYPIAAQEMRASGEFVRATMYGNPLGRPGLFAWLIAALTDVLGDRQVLVAARLIAAASTVLLGLTLAWLVRRLFNDRLLAAFAAAIFLSGDTLLQRGWHAYVDPLFALITFAAIACLWVATQERRRDFLLLAALALAGSFLAKALTGYVFYGAFGLILLWRHRNRGFLFTPWSLVLHAAALAFPLVWDYAAGDAVFWAMLGQIAYNASTDSPRSVTAFAGLFVLYPLRTFVFLAPTSAVVVYALVSRRLPPAAFRENTVLIALAAAAINLLPYWFTPASSPRYLLPIYPLFALVMAYAVLKSGKFIIDLDVKALIATVAIAWVAALIGFPAYEHAFRGSYDRAAEAIIAHADGAPIFTTDDSAIGLSITADINARRAPAAPVTRPPPDFASGLVLSTHPDPALGTIDMTFAVGRDPDGRRTRYLLCRGDACKSGGKAAAPLTF